MIQTEEIFEDNLLDTFYPQDCKTFVSTTLWHTMIGMAKMLMETGSTRNSRNRLPNHKLFDSVKEAQREDYCSL